MSQSCHMTHAMSLTWRGQWGEADIADIKLYKVNNVMVMWHMSLPIIKLFHLNWWRQNRMWSNIYNHVHGLGVQAVQEVTCWRYNCADIKLCKVKNDVVMWSMPFPIIKLFHLNLWSQNRMWGNTHNHIHGLRVQAVQEVTCWRYICADIKLCKVNNDVVMWPMSFPIIQFCHSRVMKSKHEVMQQMQQVQESCSQFHWQLLHFY